MQDSPVMEAPHFDPEFYRVQPGAAAGLAHFLARGDAAGLDPCPYFSTRFYKARYPDWQANGARTAFGDFLARIAAGVPRQPHPLIDPQHYAASYPDLAGLGAGAVLHFFTHGDDELRSPSAGFDAGFYQRCYLPLGARRPFRHFVTQGQGLGHLPRPLPRGFAQSQTAIATELPPGRPVLLVAHDAQAAGVPILTLDLAAELRQRGLSPVFLLHRGGPLIDRFRALGPVHLLAEGWDLPGLVAALPPATPVLVTSAVAADMAPAIRAAGHPCLVLIHEMPDYLRSLDLIAPLQQAQAAGARLILSMPRMVRPLESDLGPLPVLRPGILLPPTPLAAFRKALHWRRAAHGPVFISAGHADHRKGFDLFLEAAQAIRKRRPRARFVWLGALDDWAASLARAAIAGGLRLTLPGFVADAAAWYRAADAYLLTSRQDPGPTTVIHAAALGTPFVGYAADIGIIGMTAGVGEFVPPGDLAGFVDRALKIRPTMQSRRALRHHIRAETGFGPYVDGVLAALSPAAPDAAA